MSAPRRVVVTGMGAVSALGHSVADHWNALSNGKSGIGPIELPEIETVRFRNGAQVRGLITTDHFSRNQLGWLDRFAQLGLVAAREAVNDANLEWSAELRQRTAVVTGCAAGGQAAVEQIYANLWREGRNKAPVSSILRFMPNALASHVSMEFGTTGPAFTMSTACASANHAIGHAFWLVRGGLVDVALGGASESPFNIGHLKAWESMRVVAADTCRPFCRTRTGLILGEAGAMLVLESLDHARQRGARIYGEVVGFGMSADAHHVTKPFADGAAQSIRAALADGGISADAIGYINAHGTGTLVNDPTETAAIRSVFGDHANHLAVSSTKSMHGHALGASGAIEAVATLLALKNSLLPPTINYVEPDPDCDLDVIPNAPRSAHVNFALSNSFAFGGLNAVLAFRRWTGE